MMQRYGYAVAVRLVEAAASSKANDTTSPPHQWGTKQKGQHDRP